MNLISTLILNFPSFHHYLQALSNQHFHSPRHPFNSTKNTQKFHLFSGTFSFVSMSCSLLSALFVIVSHATFFQKKTPLCMLLCNALFHHETNNFVFVIVCQAHVDNWGMAGQLSGGLP
jgi:hypothetical protein